MTHSCDIEPHEGLQQDKRSVGAMIALLVLCSWLVGPCSRLTIFDDAYLHLYAVLGYELGCLAGFTGWAVLSTHHRYCRYPSLALTCILFAYSGDAALLSSDELVTNAIVCGLCVLFFMAVRVLFCMRIALQKQSPESEHTKPRFSVSEMLVWPIVIMGSLIAAKSSWVGLPLSDDSWVYDKNMRAEMLVQLFLLLPAASVFVFMVCQKLWLVWLTIVFGPILVGSVASFFLHGYTPTNLHHGVFYGGDMFWATIGWSLLPLAATLASMTVGAMLFWLGYRSIRVPATHLEDA